MKRRRHASSVCLIRRGSAVSWSFSLNDVQISGRGAESGKSSTTTLNMHFLCITEFCVVFFICLSLHSTLWKVNEKIFNKIFRTNNISSSPQWLSSDTGDSFITCYAIIKEQSHSCCLRSVAIETVMYSYPCRKLIDILLSTKIQNQAVFKLLCSWVKKSPAVIKSGVIYVV